MDKFPQLEELIARLERSKREQKALETELQRAGAAPQHRQYGTAGGALFGGLGEGLQSIAGVVRGNAAQDALTQNQARADTARQTALKMALGEEPSPARDAASPNRVERVNSSPWQGSALGSFSLEQPPGSTTGSIPRSFIEGLTAEPSNQEKAAAMVAALRRNPRTMATLLASSGDPTLETVGLMQRQDLTSADAAAARQREHAAALAKSAADYQRSRTDKLSDAQSDRTFQAREHELNRLSAERAAAIAAGQKAADAKRGTGVPGLEPVQGGEPTADDAKKVKASLASAQRMKKYITELRDLHTKHGTEYGGDAGNRMQALTQQIRLEAKNIGELGALSGPDMGIVEQIAQADPGSFTANFKGLFGVDNTTGSLTGLEKWVDDTLAGNMEAYGYAKKNGTAGVDDVLKAFGR